MNNRGFIYIFILNNLQLVRTNWSQERCNPLYIPFAGIINGKTGSVSQFEYTLENFNYCIQGLSKDVANYTMDPYNFLMYSLTHLFSIFTDLLSAITAYFSSIIDSILYYLKDAYLSILNGSIEFMRIGVKIKDSFAKIAGIITVVFYTLILQMNVVFLWIILVPQYTAITMLLGAITTSVITGIALLVATLCCPWFLFGFCCPIAVGLSRTLITQLIIILILVGWLAVITAFTNSVFKKIKVVGMPVQL